MRKKTLSAVGLLIAWTGFAGAVAPWEDAEDAFFGDGGAWASQCLVNWHKKELRLLVVQFDGDYYIRDIVAKAAERFFNHKVDDSGVNAYTGRMK